MPPVHGTTVRLGSFRGTVLLTQQRLTLHVLWRIRHLHGDVMCHGGVFHRRAHIALMAGERQLGIQDKPA